MTCFRSALSPLALLAVFVVAGCGGAPTDEAGVEQPALQTRADSVAWRMVQAHGGLDAWANAPHLRFDFAIARDGQTQVVAKHLWNRQTGDYRLEWQTAPDSQYVALFNVSAFGETASQSAPEAGRIYLNGTAVDSAAHAALMQQAHQRFVNDSYWLLAPLKVFDPGVNRTYLPDSSTAQHDVIKLTFGDVGLTPGDTYWMYVSTETGRLDRWAFHLQGMPADAAPRFFDWTAYQTFEVAGGPLELAARKESASSPSAIVFPALGVPASVPDGAFTNPEPML